MAAAAAAGCWLLVMKMKERRGGRRGGVPAAVTNAHVLHDQGRLILGGMTHFTSQEMLEEAKTWEFILQQILMSKSQNTIICVAVAHK